jgi:hypothetical protein
MPSTRWSLHLDRLNRASFARGRHYFTADEGFAISGWDTSSANVLRLVVTILFARLSSNSYSEVRHANIQMGFDENAMNSVLDEGLWGPDFSQLTECGAAELLVPIGPWVNGRLSLFSQNPKLRFPRGADAGEDLLLKDAGELMKKSLDVRTFHLRCDFH